MLFLLLPFLSHISISLNTEKKSIYIYIKYKKKVYIYTHTYIHTLNTSEEDVTALNAKK